MPMKRSTTSCTSFHDESANITCTKYRKTSTDDSSSKRGKKQRVAVAASVASNTNTNVNNTTTRGIQNLRGSLQQCLSPSSAFSTSFSPVWHAYLSKADRSNLLLYLYWYIFSMQTSHSGTFLKHQVLILV